MADDNKKKISSKSGDYEVIRKLGGGYTGDVFLVKDLNRKRPAALKLLNPSALEESGLDAFKREFMLLSDLHHPHLCQVYDFGYSENKKQYFFTLELVAGTDLYHYTDQLSVEEIEEIFVQITDALGFIHSAGLIHFDVKGDNILITTTSGNKPLAKIVDFGLAVPSVEIPENIAGTVRYLSPEMVNRRQAIDYRADLYSLGIVLYRMLARKYPCEGTTLKEVLAWHTLHTSIDTKPLQERGTPKYLIDVAEKLTQPIPTDRFSSAAVIIKYIELHSGKTYTKTQRKLVATLMEEGPLVARDELITKIKQNLQAIGKKNLEEMEDNASLIITGQSGSGKSRTLKEAKYIAQLGEVNVIAINGKNEGQDIKKFLEILGLKEGDNDVFQSLLNQQPLCVMIDDLDKCNGPIKESFTGIVNSLYSARFMGETPFIYLMATMTTASAETALPVPLHLGIDHEHLRLFSREDIAQYIRQSLGEENPPTKQIEDIFNFTGGNPELVKTAIASLDSPTSRLTKDASQLITDRIVKLSSTSKKILGFITLAGKPITQHHLITLTDLIVDNPLKELIREGLICFDRESEKYSVASGAINAAAENSFDKAEKKEISRKLLSYFEKEEPEDIDSMAKYALAGLPQKDTTDYLIKAAEAKEAKSEFEDALKYYNQAIAILDIKDARAPKLYRKISRYLIFAGKYDEALKNIESISKISGIIAEDLTKQSWIYRLKHRPEEAIKFIEKALESIEKDVQNPEYLKLINEKAYCYIQMGKANEALEILKESHEHAKKLPDEKKKLVANNNLGVALALKGNFDAAIKFYKEKYEYFSDNKQLSASILSQLGYVYQEAGRLTEGIETYKKSWELYSNMGDTHSSMAILGNIICMCQSKALFTDALRYVQESIKLASRSGSEKELACNFLNLGNLYVTLGLEDVASKYLSEATSIFEKLGDVYMQEWVGISLAHLYKNLDKHREALAYFNNVIKKGRELKFNDLLLWGQLGAAEILMDIGDLSKIEEYLSGINIEWKGKESAKEADIKVELFKIKYLTAKNKAPDEKIPGRLKELADVSKQKELRELESETYHALGMFYQKHNNPSTAAEYFEKSREIIDNIANTLSEEYRDSFLKQKFRKDVLEKSIKFKSLAPEIEKEISATPKAQAEKGGEVSVKTDGIVSVSETIFSKPPAGGGRISITEIVGQSYGINRIRDIINKAKDSNFPVLLVGEPGSGKKQIAEKIKESGVYNNRKLEFLDITTLSEEFLDQTLFGEGENAGLLESAEDGIVFLENIERLTSSLQKKIAKVLKDKVFVRRRSKQAIPFRARIIVGTSIPLKKLKLKWRLKKQLSHIIIEVPPLRERHEDIPLLIDSILKKIADETPPKTQYAIEPAAIKLLINYDWPKNILELEHVLRNACTLSADRKITEEHIRTYIGLEK